MASNYDRRINLYVNIDGKEVKNNVQSIRAEMTKIVNAQKQMTIGSDEYLNASSKIKQLKGILDDHGKAIKNTETPIQKLIGTAKGLLPALGFGAIAAGAKFAFDKVVASTDVLSTKWAVFTGGLKSGMNEFWRTIAVGDWSNFTENMKAAIKVGREYETMLDDIEEKGRALRIKEAESRKTELDLEEKLKNKGLSNEERLAAGQARIQLEEDLAKERVKVAQETFDAELKVTQQQTRLSKEQLMQVVSDMDSEKKIKAKAYLEQLALYESTLQKSEQFKVAATRSGITKNPFAKELEDSKAILDSYPESVKIYSEAIKGVGSTTDEQLNKMVTAYEGLLQARDSAAENTKKTRTMVNSLIAGEEGDGNKIADDANKLVLDGLAKAHNARMAVIITQNEQEKWTAHRFKEEQLAEESVYLVMQKALLESSGQSTADIDKKLNENRIESQKNLNEQLLENEKSLRNQVDELDKNFLEHNEAIASEEEAILANSILANSDSIDESLDLIKDQKDKEKAILEQRAQNYQMISGTIVGSLSDMISGSLDEYESYGDALVLMALQILKQMAPIWAAQIVGGSLATPDSILTGGLAGIAKFTAMLAIMNGFIGLAEKGVKKKIEKKKSAAGSKGYASGGYALEEQYRVAEAGPEWIAPNWMISHPYTGRIIAGLEDMRENPVRVSQQAYGVSKSIRLPQIDSGNNTTSTAGSASLQQPLSIDPMLKRIIEGNTKAMELNSQATALLMKNGVQFPIVGFMKQYKEIDEIINHTGLTWDKKK